MKRLFLCVMILTLSLTTLAQAGDWIPETRTDRWDFSIMTRYSWSKEIIQDTGSKIDFDGDTGWGFGFSKYLSENVNVGLVFAWHSIYYTATAVGEVVGDTHTYSNTLSTSTLALYGDYAFGTKKWQPYVSGNLGWLRANTNITADIDGGCYNDPYVGYVCGTWKDST